MGDFNTAFEGLIKLLTDQLDGKAKTDERLRIVEFRTTILWWGGCITIGFIVLVCRQALIKFIFSG